MTVNLALVLGSAAWIIFLFAVEAYTAMKGIPTISERMTALGRSAPIVIMVTLYVLGVLADHFWGHP